MSAKKATTEEKEREAIQTEGDTPAGAEDFPGDVSGGGQEEGFKFDTTFNADEEYKVPPLIPVGTYEGYVTKVEFLAADNALAWDVTLKAEPDVMMSDNTTPVNGVTTSYKNWFPKAGDENKMTGSNKMTKRQAKINMIKDFQDKMKINMNTPEDIIEGVTNAEWVGLEVLVTIEIREYQGRFSNQIKSMVAA
jgi:hypothetical protein